MSLQVRLSRFRSLSSNVAPPTNTLSASDFDALLTDPGGLGWVAKVGDFVGKSELVHAGGPTGTDVAVNWRVDRIRDGDIVFIREDPSHPEIPPTTRVVALRTPEEEAGQKGPRK